MRGPFEKFVDSHYYSDSELCGGAVGDCMADDLMGFHRPTFSKPNKELKSDLAAAISGLFQQLKGSFAARNFEVVNGLQQVFGKWVERCKKCIACQGR
jgi:hypothetical protein